MKRLLVAAALAPLTFAAGQTGAQIVSTSTSTPVVSANGATITINAGVAVTLPSTTSGTKTAQAAAVTLDASTNPPAPPSGTTTVNSVINSGAVNSTGANYVTGILVNGAGPLTTAQAGNFGSIANAGTITLNETTSYTDTNSDGIVDTNGKVLGQYATGTNRYGIQTAGSLYDGSIGNAGTISVIGENSAGILIGAGGIGGNLSNLGTISITGGNGSAVAGGTPSTDVSYGINALGPIGSVNLSGTITALGHNAIGVNLGGPVVGFQTTTSTTTGGVTTTSTTTTPGAVEINATITATGYRSTIAPTTPSVLALVTNQASSELLQGGPALAIGGSVKDGISLDAAIVATGTTSAVAGAVITSDGRAPAVLIGSAPTAPITIGTFGTSGYGLVVGGTVSGVGVYDLDSAGQPVGANGVQIGVSHIDNDPTSATSGQSQDGSGRVTIAGGVDVTGTIQASSISKTVVTGKDGNPLTGDATALWLDAATTPRIDVSGTIAASSTAANGVPVNVTAILLGANASIPSLTNIGTIQAAIGGIAGVLNSPASGGNDGYAFAIRDKSGSLTSVTNSGRIAASITPIDVTQLVLPGSRTIAIDLSANTTTATVTQVTDPTLTGVTAAGVTTTFSPTISGDVLFGSTGSGVLQLQAGTLAGGMMFGSGAGNDIEISNGAIAAGALSEAAGGQLKINVANGILDILAPVSNPDYTTTATKPAPTFGATQAAGGIGVSSVHVGSTGQLILSVGTTTAGSSPAVIAANSLIVGPQLNLTASGGTVTFDAGAKLGLNFVSKLTQTTTYNLIEAGTGKITLGDGTPGSVKAVLGDIPYLYSGTITQTTLGANDAVSVTVNRKSAQDLGFNRAEASAYDAVYAAFDNSDKTNNVGIGSIAAAMLGADTRASFLKLYDQMLPDYSGGPFEDLVLGQQGLARAEEEAPTKMEADTSRGWVQEIGYYNSRNASDAANGYNGKGFGLAGGVEHAYSHSSVGFAAAFVSSSVHDLARSDGSSQGANAVEAGVYWREGGPEGLDLSASVNGGLAVMESRRVLMDQSGTDAATLYRQAKGSWLGGVASAALSASYKEDFGRYYVKPEVLADYVMLYEQAYTEHGGGDAYDLTVGSKLSKEAIVQADMVFGATYGTATRWSPELTVGWRQTVYGGPADTTAHFQGGTPFKLSPNYQDKGGLVARIGLRAAGNFADFSANAGGVFRSDYRTYDARASARFLF